jgi:hypothetical protein
MSFNSQVNYSWKSDHLINWFSSQITRLLKHPRNCICPLSDSVRLIPSNIVIICSHSSTSLFPKFLLRDKFHSLCAKFASDPPWSRESCTGLDIESLETFLNAHIFPKSCPLPTLNYHPFASLIPRFNCMKTLPKLRSTYAVWLTKILVVKILGSE